ncbi:MAG: hypothetical protein J6K75_04640, partial [Erysipelotrichaceae bacterium]|nr:hypothetical protein [Erysipelotrichaceae bacterium]
MTYVHAETCEAMKPVVFIHGIIAGMLEGEVNVAEDTEVAFPDKCSRTYKHCRMWVALKDVNPLVNECILGYLTPLWDSSKKQQYDPEGITVTSPKFGSTYACDEIDPNFPVSLFAKVFHELIKKLEKVGYVDGDNMLGASYDWRYYRFNEYSHKDNWYKNTKELIETAYNSYGKVVLISHSMGGLMTYRLLDYLGSSFCSKYIDNWVAMSAPFLGSAKTIAAAFPGDNLGLPIADGRIRPMARQIETVALLFPIGGTAKYGKDVLMTITSTGDKYTADDLDALIDTLDNKHFQGNYHYVVAHGMKEVYNKYNWKVPHGVKMNCLITSGVETISGVTMASYDYDTDPTFTYGDGDGTVNIQSLEFCQDMGAAYFENLGKKDHTGILDASVSWTAVKKYVC